MNKKQSQGIGLLVVIMLVIAGISMLHEAIGTVGLVVLGLCVVGGFIGYVVAEDRRDQRQFEDLVRYVLYNRLEVGEAQKMNRRLMKENPTKAQLIRNLQILRDSIDIALSTKKSKTATSRMGTARQCHSDIHSEQKNLVSGQLLSEIDSVMNSAETQFHTDYYVNLSQGYLEKAESLKTNKSKRKYLQLAKDTLREGLQDEWSRREEINRAWSSVEEFEALVEG